MFSLISKYFTKPQEHRPKVLLVGAGRRVSLAEHFMDSGFDVYAYETELNAPIGLRATIIPGLRWDDPNLINDLTNACNLVDLVLPLMDKATVALSQIKEAYPKLLKHRIVTSPESANTICLNKQAFETLFQERDFYPVLKQYQSVICKPIYGANSKDLHILTWQEYYNTNPLFVENYVAQRYIHNGTEFSVDAYFNKAGKMVDAVPRQRLAVQGGEVSQSITLPRTHHGLVDLTRQVGEEIGLVGPVCAQFIVDPIDNKAYIMEINSRFGGGVTLSLQAGLNMIDLLKREYIDKEPIEPQDYPWKENFGMIRYFKDHYYEN